MFCIKFLLLSWKSQLEPHSKPFRLCLLWIHIMWNLGYYAHILWSPNDHSTTAMVYIQPRIPQSFMSVLAWPPLRKAISPYLCEEELRRIQWRMHWIVPERSPLSLSMLAYRLGYSDCFVWCPGACNEFRLWDSASEHCSIGFPCFVFLISM